jgi:hypothetical protein
MPVIPVAEAAVVPVVCPVKVRQMAAPAAPAVLAAPVAPEPAQAQAQAQAQHGLGKVMK